MLKSFKLFYLKGLKVFSSIIFHLHSLSMFFNKTSSHNISKIAPKNKIEESKGNEEKQTNKQTKKSGRIDCYIYIYIYIYIYEVHPIRFLTFFLWAFKIDVDSWKFSMLLLYILGDDWPSFMISGPKEQLQQQLEYTLLKPDCHSWWISKMQSGLQDNLEERYAIKFCFKLGKNATETYGMLQTAFGAYCMNRASIFEWQD